MPVAPILSPFYLGFLFVLGAQAPAPKSESNELLWEGARKGDSALVLKALKAGADINAKTDYGATALHFASDKGHLEVVKLLLAQKAKPNELDSFYGTKPITWAAMRGHAQVVGALIEGGANGADGALMVVVGQGDVATAKVLVEKGKPGLLTLASALLMTDKPEMIDVLKKAGAKPSNAPKPSQASLSQFGGTYQSKDFGELVIKSQGNGLAVESGGKKIHQLTQTGKMEFKAEGNPLVVVFQEKGGKTEGLVWKLENQPDREYRRKPTEAAAEPVPVVRKKYADPDPKVSEIKNWPQFRGIAASGVADGQFPPTNFDIPKGVNVLWKAPIPGLGHSCPVIWENKVFLTTAVGNAEATLKPGQYGDVDSVNEKEVHTWYLYCLDRDQGKVLWKETICQGVPKLKRHLKGTHANPTAAVDGKVVVVSLGAEGLFAFDLNGKKLWQQDLGKLDSSWFYDPEYQWGFGSSPILHNGKVFVQCDAGKESYLGAYRLSDGASVWKTPRDVIPSWGTPTLIVGPKGDELVANGTKHAIGYDPETGKELWRVGRLSEITVPTPIGAHGLIFVCSGYRPVQPIYAVKAGARGDLTPKTGETTSDGLAWSLKSGGPYMPTPLAYGDHLYVLANNGLLTCYEAKTGKKIYSERIGGSSGYTAAPVAADGRLYCVSETHGVRVVRLGPTYELMAINPVGETCMASPAISAGKLFLRTEKHLYALGVTAPSRAE